MSRFKCVTRVVLTIAKTTDTHTARARPLSQRATTIHAAILVASIGPPIAHIPGGRGAAAAHRPSRRSAAASTKLAAASTKLAVASAKLAATSAKLADASRKRAAASAKLAAAAVAANTDGKFSLVKLTPPRTFRVYRRWTRRGVTGTG